MTLIKPTPGKKPTKPGRPEKAAPLPQADLADLLGLSTAAASTKELVPQQNDRDRPKAPSMPVPPRRGYARPFCGRAPLPPAVPVVRGSTGQLSGLYPFLYGHSLPPVGVYMGIDCLSGAAFSCHPIEWLHHGLVTNPNILVTGVPGAGKSATVKALALRLMAYGVKTFVLGDLKNEYAALARTLGVEPVELGPGLPGRVNPLDSGPLGRNLPPAGPQLDERLAEIHRRRITLLSSLVEMRLHRPLTPTEEAAVSQAIRHAAGIATGTTYLTDPTIPDVWRLLRDPVDDMATELRTAGATDLRERVRPVADAIGNMITGSLSGLFDGPTTVAPDFTAPIQTVDISRLDGRGDDTVAMILACVSSWGQAAIDDPNGPVRMVVRDELWRAMRIPAMVKKLDADLRLSRSQGTIQMLCSHRLSDFEAVGSAGSAEVAIAKSLIGSCDVRVCLAQDTAPLNITREVIGLTDTEAAHIASWGAEQRGRALWKVGRTSSSIVHTVLSPVELELFWTNERMTV
ncbi:VirB4 family type IV secretion system protein [Stackebrandtia nassauensis]|uniref:Type IV secretory pathway VirB4 protein-like protein n=1 Tax=Stackebrandtia nassauensis (strain DSM 44728 / CIP 108903 / NRRL B-16338 / NBRC 102104 / LLR-40K-21) TaxID=446470 RepID=D3PVU6_STANL|nr:type VI secretion protein [Stackebrandtia nassauensis]ADD45067.1 Type IV secretory pathway VirB4 protein-like protein [Stackebrandtia nassauensis DSM 44728]